MKTHFTLNTFFPKIIPFMKYVEKCGKTRQATDDNTMRRMRFTCCINKTTDTQSEYVILIFFPQQQWFREGAQCYIACALPVLFAFISLHAFVLNHGSYPNIAPQVSVSSQSISRTYKFSQLRSVFVLPLLYVCCSLSFHESTDQQFVS
jgi:hypothetical protein